MKINKENLQTFWQGIKKPPYPAAFVLYFVITLFFDAVLGLSRHGGIGYLIKHLLASAIFVSIFYWLIQKGWLQWKDGEKR